jgi:hypothetical protein
MVKIGDQIETSEESKKKPGSTEKPGKKEIKKADSPAAGASKDESSLLASEEHQSSSEISEGGKTSSENTKKKGTGQRSTDTESKKESGRSKKEFYENTIISQVDVGKTLFNKIEEIDKSADPVTELSDTEQALLEKMIFQGYVSHTMYMREGFPFSFRSCPPIAMNIGNDILQTHVGAGEEKMSGLFTCMVIAVYLEQYGNQEEGNLYISHKSKTQEDFTSKEAIQERFDFCVKRLNGIIVDVLRDRLREFLDLLNRVGKSRNVLNF